MFGKIVRIGVVAGVEVFGNQCLEPVKSEISLCSANVTIARPLAFWAGSTAWITRWTALKPDVVVGVGRAEYELAIVVHPGIAVQLPQGDATLKELDVQNFSVTSVPLLDPVVDERLREGEVSTMALEEDCLVRVVQEQGRMRCLTACLSRSLRDCRNFWRRFE